MIILIIDDDTEALKLLDKTSVDIIISNPSGFRLKINDDGPGLEEVTGLLECQIVTAAMEKTNHNQTQAAKLLKITRGALQYKLKKYRIISSQNKKAA